MKRKILAALLASTMVLSLAGCGGGSDAPAADNGTAATEEAPAAEAPAADSGAAEEAPAADAAAGGEETLTVWCWDPAFNMNAMYEAEKVYQKECGRDSLGGCSDQDYHSGYFRRSEHIA